MSTIMNLVRTPSPCPKLPMSPKSGRKRAVTPVKGRKRDLPPATPPSKPLASLLHRVSDQPPKRNSSNASTKETDDTNLTQSSCEGVPIWSSGGDAFEDIIRGDVSWCTPRISNNKRATGKPPPTLASEQQQRQDESFTIRAGLSCSMVSLGSNTMHRSGEMERDLFSSSLHGSFGDFSEAPDVHFSKTGHAPGTQQPLPPPPPPPDDGSSEYHLLDEGSEFEEESIKFDDDDNSEYQIIEIVDGEESEYEEQSIDDDEFEAYLRSEQEHQRVAVEALRTGQVATTVVVHEGSMRDNDDNISYDEVTIESAEFEAYLQNLIHGPETMPQAAAIMNVIGKDILVDEGADGEPAYKSTKMYQGNESPKKLKRDSTAKKEKTKKTKSVSKKKDKSTDPGKKTRKSSSKIKSPSATETKGVVPEDNVAEVTPQSPSTLDQELSMAMSTAGDPPATGHKCSSSSDSKIKTRSSSSTRKPSSMRDLKNSHEKMQKPFSLRDLEPSMAMSTAGSPSVAGHKSSKSSDSKVKRKSSSSTRKPSSMRDLKSGHEKIHKPCSLRDLNKSPHRKSKKSSTVSLVSENLDSPRKAKVKNLDSPRKAKVKKSAHELETLDNGLGMVPDASPKKEAASRNMRRSSRRSLMSEDEEGLKPKSEPCLKVVKEKRRSRKVSTSMRNGLDDSKAAAKDHNKVSTKGEPSPEKKERKRLSKASTKDSDLKSPRKTRMIKFVSATEMEARKSIREIKAQ